MPRLSPCYTLTLPFRIYFLLFNCCLALSTFDTTPPLPFPLRALDLPSSGQTCVASQGMLSKGCEPRSPWRLGSSSHPTPSDGITRKPRGHTAPRVPWGISVLPVVRAGVYQTMYVLLASSLSLPRPPRASPSKGFTGSWPQGLLHGTQSPSPSPPPGLVASHQGSASRGSSRGGFVV